MSDDFTRGFLEGVEVAARIFRNHIGATRQECPRCGPPDAEVSQYPADHPQPMVAYTPPTVGFYRLPEETD